MKEPSLLWHGGSECIKNHQLRTNFKKENQETRKVVRKFLILRYLI